jgi:hypothetical protein
MVTVIVRKMYALILKSVWSLVRTLVDRKNAPNRGTRPEHIPQETAWEGFRRGRSRGAAVDGIRHRAKRGAKREREAERCLTTLKQGRLLLKLKHRTIYIHPPGVCAYNI